MSDCLWKLPFQGELRRMEPMREHTTLRVGGPADLFLEAQGEEDVVLAWRACRECGVPLTLLGRGSNLLVLDGGIEGLVLSLGEGFAQTRVEGCALYAQAGAKLKALANLALDAGLTGLEFAEGIPGSLGGAAWMNAGAYGGEMAQVVESLRVLDREGRCQTLPVQELAYGYRHSRMMDEGLLVLSAKLRLQPGDRERIGARMQELSRLRREKQPLQYPSCGSFFKRPEGYFAGKLIQDAGLKGARVGDAQISTQHAGFLINLGNASAADVIGLMRLVQKEVYERFSVRLEPEVRIVGRDL